MGLTRLQILISCANAVIEKDYTFRSRAMHIEMEPSPAEDQKEFEAPQYCYREGAYREDQKELQI
jgi:hypothetical protein